MSSTTHIPTPTPIPLSNHRNICDVYLKALSLDEMGFTFYGRNNTIFPDNSYQLCCNVEQERFVVTVLAVDKLTNPIIMVTNSLTKIYTIDDDRIDLPTRRLILLGYLKELGFKPAATLLRVHKIDSLQLNTTQHNSNQED